MAVLTNIDISKRVNKNGIVIYPFEESSLTGLGYDLNIGIIKPLSLIDKFKETPNGEIHIPAGGYCIIITKEYLWISKKYVGSLHARASLAAKGLFLNSTNVDPNFKGQMIMSIFNASGVDITLKKEQKFITLILHEVKSPTKMQVGYQGTKNSLGVITEMRNNIYTAINSLERTSIEDLNDYLINSNTSLQPIFDKIVTNSSGWLPKEVRKSKWAIFLNLIIKFGNSISNFLIVILFLSAVYFTFIFIKKSIDKTGDKIENFQALAAAIIAIIGSFMLLKNIFKKK